MSAVGSTESRRALVAALGEQVQQLEQAHRPPLGPPLSSGTPALDAVLPQRGFAAGALVEWLAPLGGGAATLALLAAREACRRGGVLVVVDRSGRFYPPAAAAWKLDLERVLLVRPKQPRDELWACDQALRTPHVSALLCWPEKLDPHTFRRWQLAAESSGTLGLLVRPLAARGEPSWAAYRCLVEPQAGDGPRTGRRLHVEVLRGASGRPRVELELGG